MADLLDKTPILQFDNYSINVVLGFYFFSYDTWMLR